VAGNQRGILEFYNASVPFFSSMLASGDRLYRGMIRDPGQRASTIGKVAMLAGMSVANQEINLWMEKNWGHIKDENGTPYIDYGQLEDWQKAGYWHSYIPLEWNLDTLEPSKFQHIMLPKLWEVGVIATLAELSSKSWFHDDPEDREVGLQAAKVVANNFNLHLFDDSMPIPVPAGLDTILEQYSERVGYTGQPIESRAMKQRDPWTRTRANTPQVFKKMGEALKNAPDVVGLNTLKSPVKADALARNIFGAYAKDVGQMTEHLLPEAEASVRGLLQSIGLIGTQMMDEQFFTRSGTKFHWDDLPVVRRFLPSW
jgi:hypothetical protein